jgi:hypothetical protein
MPSKSLHPLSLHLTPRIKGLLEVLALNQTVKMHRAISCSAVMRALIHYASTQPGMENAIRSLVIHELQNGRAWGRPKKAALTTS